MTHLLRCTFPLCTFARWIVPALALFVAASLLPGTAYADELAWTRALGNGFSEQAIGIGVDRSGNLYATGMFQGTVDFDPGPGVANHSSGNHLSVYIVKFDPNGNLLWVKVISGSGAVAVAGIAVAPNGEIHLTGNFKGTVDLAPGPASASVEERGGGDLFLVKLDPDGNFLWGFGTGSESSDSGGAVAVDAQGYVYITGSFEEAVDFDPGPSGFHLVSAGEDDIFIARYRSDGAFSWARSFSGEEDGHGSALAVHANGDIVVAGTFKGRFDFDPADTSSEFRSAGDDDIFIVLLTSGGLWRWTTIIGGSNEEEKPDLAVDAAGNTYVGGTFMQSADFDRRSDGGLLFSHGQEDIFLAKYGPGGVFLWAHAIGSGHSDEGEAVAVDGAGAVYITGNFESTVDFDPGPGQRRLTATGEDDIFVARFSTAGALLAAEALSGPLDEESRDIVVDHENNVYITGDFQGKVGLNLQEAAPATSDADEYDVVIAKLLRTIPKNVVPKVFVPLARR